MNTANFKTWEKRILSCGLTRGSLPRVLQHLAVHLIVSFWANPLAKNCRTQLRWTKIKDNMSCPFNDVYKSNALPQKLFWVHNRKRGLFSHYLAFSKLQATTENDPQHVVVLQPWYDIIQAYQHTCNNDASSTEFAPHGWILLFSLEIDPFLHDSSFLGGWQMPHGAGPLAPFYGATQWQN